MQEPAVTPDTPTQAEGLSPPSSLETDAGVAAESQLETPSSQETAEGQSGQAEEQVTVPTSFEELEQTEWFPAALEERDQSRDDGLRKEMKREAWTDLDARMQRREATLGNAFQGLQKMQRSLERLVDDGGWDKRAAEDWAADHQEVVNALNGSFWSAGVEKILGHLAAAAGDQHLMPEMDARLSNVLQGQRDPTFFADFVDKLAEAKVKEAKEAATKPLREKISRMEAQMAQQKVAANKGGPNISPGRAAGGRSDAERQLDPTTPIEELVEINARQSGR